MYCNMSHLLFLTIIINIYLFILQLIPDDIIIVLRSWFNEHPKEVLHMENIDKIKNLITLLCRRTEDEQQLKEADIYVPDECGVMRLSSSLYYNDAPTVDKLDKYRGSFVHRDITRTIAQMVGVKMVVAEVLKNLQSKENFPFSTAFGQKEELITRIKNILEEYSGKIDVFKELLQNADDSGATEFHVLLDKRSFSQYKDRVLNKNSHYILGPALVTANDKSFSEEDYKGLQSLGTGSKRGDDFTIGKFGIGFNTAYEYTDTPMFISNDKFVILDPHLEFCEVGSETQPGAMFDVNDGFRSRCHDMMRGFQFPQGFSMPEKTIFRLPLRNEFDSQISTSTNLEENLQSLQQQLIYFAKCAPSCLLFLSNVKKVTVSLIDENGQVKCLTSTSSTINDDPVMKKADIVPMDTNGSTSYKLRVKSTFNNGTSKSSSHYEVAWSSLKDSNGSRQVAGVAVNMRELEFGGEQGELYVGLPIKQEISLPVQICGNFELDPGRNRLKPHSSWNKLLMTGKIL